MKGGRSSLPHAIPLPKRGKGTRFQAQHVNDFRPGIDRVERDATGRAWVVDGQGHYAPIEVWGDALPPDFAERVSGLTDDQRHKLYRATLGTPFLSEEGKTERLAILRPLLRWTIEIVPL